MKSFTTTHQQDMGALQAPPRSPLSLHAHLLESTQGFFALDTTHCFKHIIFIVSTSTHYSFFKTMRPYFPLFLLYVNLGTPTIHNTIQKMHSPHLIYITLTIHYNSHYILIKPLALDSSSADHFHHSLYKVFRACSSYAIVCCMPMAGL